MIMAQTLADVLTALSKRESPPPWHELQPLIAAAARHTEHVSGCTECEAWTESPDAKGRCDQCAIACDACGRALEDADDGATTAGGRLLCLDCYADDGEPAQHGRHCRCDRCAAMAEDAEDARRELAREDREVRT